MDRVFPLLLTLGILLSAGCAPQPIRQAPGEASSLQRWLDAELAPYLAGQLGRQPRFKGESVILVSLDGSDIQPDIDGLTRSLREQLMDGLLSDAAVTLPWQPQQPPAQHHRRLDHASCERIRDADYYIGIEISRTGTAQYRVSVRALDVRAGEWVSGFGMSWSGALTPGELRARQERRTDESLRGLRVLPFSSAHPDLAASYLANNLSCLLLQQDEEDLVIYVDSLQSDQPGLRTLLGLVGNNLSRYHEVRVTDVKKEANFVLRGEAHEVQPRLYQVWVVLHPKNSGEHLPGIDTDSCSGPHATRSGDAGIVDGCPELELTVERADRVFVFVHGSRDGISRLSSGACRNGGEDAAGVPGKRTYRFPAGRFPDTDWPTVYAIAVSGSELAKQFTGLLQVLPDACGNAPGMRADNNSMEQWLDRLDRLIAANGEHAVWTARRIP